MTVLLWSLRSRFSSLSNILLTIYAIKTCVQQMVTACTRTAYYLKDFCKQTSCCNRWHTQWDPKGWKHIEYMSNSKCNLQIKFWKMSNKKKMLTEKVNWKYLTFNNLQLYIFNKQQWICWYSVYRYVGKYHIRLLQTHRRVHHRGTVSVSSLIITINEFQNATTLHSPWL